MEPGEQSELDQAFSAMAEMAEHLPVAWGTMFNRCLKEGFTTDQSLKLVQTYILSQCPFGIRGIDG